MDTPFIDTLVRCERIMRAGHATECQYSQIHIKSSEYFSAQCSSGVSAILQQHLNSSAFLIAGKLHPASSARFAC